VKASGDLISELATSEIPAKDEWPNLSERLTDICAIAFEMAILRHFGQPNTEPVSPLENRNSFEAQVSPKPISRNIGKMNKIQKCEIYVNEIGSFIFTSPKKCMWKCRIGGSALVVSIFGTYWMGKYFTLCRNEITSVFFRQANGNMSSFDR